MSAPTDVDGTALAGGSADTIDVYTRKLPPIGELAIATIAVVVAGGVYLASYLPRHAPLGPAYAILGVAATSCGPSTSSTSSVAACGRGSTCSSG